MTFVWRLHPLWVGLFIASCLLWHRTSVYTTTYRWGSPCLFKHETFGLPVRTFLKNVSLQIYETWQNILIKTLSLFHNVYNACNICLLLFNDDLLIDWMEFYAGSAIFQSCNGRYIHVPKILRNICIQNTHVITCIYHTLT